jgi:hypothetical protein
VGPALAALVILAGACATDTGPPGKGGGRPFAVRVLEEVRAVFPEHPGLFRRVERDTRFSFDTGKSQPYIGEEPIDSRSCAESVFPVIGLGRTTAGQPPGRPVS